MASVTLAARCINPSLSHSPFSSETNSINSREDDFSSYFNLIRENFPPELGNSALGRSAIRISLGSKKNDDGEIDIFGAEKYFSAGMDGDSELISERAGKQLYPREGEAGAMPRSRTRSSESSGNSQSTLLRRSPTPKKNHAKGKRFLGVLRCSCYGKETVDVDRSSAEDSSSNYTKKIDRVGDKGREVCYNGEMGSRRMDRMSFVSKREEEFAFPNSKPVVGRVAAGREFGSPFLVRDDHVVSSHSTSFTVLNSAVASGGRSGARDDDLGSESSSDLFEIESLINSHPFSRPEGADLSSTCYEPSEASIEWSVVTASAANFSVSSEYGNDDHPSTRDDEANKTSKQHRPGLLLGCVSEKAVRGLAPSARPRARA